MLPELGHFALIIALWFSLLQCITAAWGIYQKNSLYLQISSTAVIGQFSFLLFCMLCLIISFLNNDLTVIYVREHSHHLLPFIYRVGAAWGGHEGSLLLWCLILSGWTLGFNLLEKHGALQEIMPQMLATLGVISCGFVAFLLLTSNPFLRDFTIAPQSGNDLNPVLQDPGLIFHPPMLYLGYVGFAIGFAFAIAVLLAGKLPSPWARACRPWIILPWSFLSCGIVLGSWWAYRELGWGGWWFWDPVENASLLPWLAATALMHALIVCEKRAVFKGWVILLAIITFALSLIGTFLVRSGVLVSVHAFASDPTRGIFLLCYLAVLLGGAFLLYGIRIKQFYQAPQFSIFSRETLLLINSVFMITAVVTILIGTLYPIVLDALNIAKISVGEPYFNTVFIPIMLPLLLLMGFAPHIQWGQESFNKLWLKCRYSMFLSFILSNFIPILLGFSWHFYAMLGMFVCFWVILTTSQYAYRIWKAQHSLGLMHSAMIIAHLGIAILALGVTLNKTYSEERQVKMAPGDKVMLAGYQFTLNNLAKTTGTNYTSLIATFAIQKNQKIRLISAEQRTYSHEQILGKTGIDFNLWRDLYLALGNPLADGSWSVRIYYKPFVRWIWLGGLMLLLGGLLSLLGQLTQRIKLRT